MEGYRRMDGMLMPREVAELMFIHLNTSKHWSDKDRTVAYRIDSQDGRGYRLQNTDYLLARFTLLHRSLSR